MESRGEEHTETIAGKAQAVLFRGGLTDAEFQSVVSDVRTHNHRLGVVVLVMLCIMFFGLCSVGVFNDYFSTFLFLYRTTFFCSAVLLIGNLTLARRYPKISTVILYLTFLLIFAFATIIGAYFGRDQFAVTICIFIVVAPLVILDRPIRLLSVPILATLGFSVVAFAIKDPEIAFTDTVDCICACFFGVLLSLQNTRMQMHIMVYGHRISRERDEDGLTKLLNKTAFERDASEYLESGKKAIMMIFDADNFKRVNDLYGHDVGDEVLRGMGECIDASVRKSDLKGRFGGDEFVVLLKGTDDATIASRAAQTVLDRMSVNIHLPNPNDEFCCSVGAAFCSGSDLNYEELFKKADLALYDAKHAGRNCYRLAD